MQLGIFSFNTGRWCVRQRRDARKSCRFSIVTRRLLRSWRDVLNCGRAASGSSSLFLALSELLRAQTRDLACHNPHFTWSRQPNANDGQQTQRNG